VRHNLNRQQPRVRLFETGLRFLPEGDRLRQEPMLAAVITGRRYPEAWTADGAPVDFYDLKGDLEAVLKLAGLAEEVVFQVGSHPALHSGQSADLYRQGRPIGRIGALHPELQRELNIDQSVYLLEVELAGLVGGPLPHFSELSKFPEVRRDLAVVVDRSVPAKAILGTVREAAGSCLRDLRLFDVYQGKGIDPQRKSLALGLTFQHSSRTLTEDEINTAVDAVINLLASRFEAILRN
jgi:phenylalanyl-tRNA synthetase beta chain